MRNRLTCYRPTCACERAALYSKHRSSCNFPFGKARGKYGRFANRSGRLSPWGLRRMGSPPGVLSPCRPVRRVSILHRWASSKLGRRDPIAVRAVGLLSDLSPSGLQASQRIAPTDSQPPTEGTANRVLVERSAEGDGTAERTAGLAPRPKAVPRRGSPPSPGRRLCDGSWRT